MRYSYNSALFSGEVVEINLELGENSAIQVREGVNVKINCPTVTAVRRRRPRFTHLRNISDVSGVTIQWLHQQQIPYTDDFSDVIDELDDGDFDGRYNHTLRACT